MALRVVFGRAELSAEECVDERRLAEPALADDHNRKVRASFGDDFVFLSRREMAPPYVSQTEKLRQRRREVESSLGWAG